MRSVALSLMLTACVSYDGYGRPHPQAEGGLEAGETGGAGSSGLPEAGTGGASEAGTGGASEAGTGGALEAGTGGASEAGTGGALEAGTGGASEAGTGGASEAGANDGAVDSGTHCGVFKSGANTVIDFSCESTLDLFDYLAPFATAAGGFPDWTYYATGNPHLLEVNNVISYVPGAADPNYVIGAFAVLRDVDITDGFVSTKTFTADDDSACLLARYQDPLHTYVLCLAYTYIPGSWYLFRYDGTRRIELRRGNVSGIHDYPGHELGLSFVGPTFRVYYDGAEMAALVDPDAYPEASVVDGGGPPRHGRVGLQAITLFDAHFDDFTYRSE